jgi:hypothetical protein
MQQKKPVLSLISKNFLEPLRRQRGGDDHGELTDVAKSSDVAKS